MPLDVGLHLLLALERFVADRALVALGPVVLHAVQLQHVVVAEVPEADITMVWLFARVRPGVHLQLLAARKTLAATLHRAFVWLLTCKQAEEREKQTRSVHAAIFYLAGTQRSTQPTSYTQSTKRLHSNRQATRRLHRN